MEGFEPKKLALLRIWQILQEHSDFNHPMTQEEISHYLEKDYGIVIERKTISRNLSLLKEAGIEIESGATGSYLTCRDFEDAELHLLIDGVLSSKHIAAKHSQDLIDRLCTLSSKYFKSSVKHICSVNDWNKTDNQDLFYNIELIDTAIEEGLQLHYDYNKYGIDKKMHKTSHQYVSPYQMLLHNQRYYLMAYSEYWGNMAFYRLDHITNMTVTDKKATPLKNVKGYENGINYRELATNLPYMYADRQENVIFLADVSVIDQIVDWFGTDVQFLPTAEENKVKVCVKASPNAMAHWAMQYINYVEILSPGSLRARITDSLENGLKKYRCETVNN